MLIAVKINGEHFDLPISGRKVKKVLLKIIAEKYNIKFIEAEQYINKFGQRNMENKFYKRIKEELRDYIKEEIQGWHAYETMIKGEKRNQKVD